MVIENEDLKMPRTDRPNQPHSDIDVIAINNKELLHIECQTWWGPSIIGGEKNLKKLKEKFDHAKDLIFRKYPFLNKNTCIKNIFVTSGKPKKGRGDGPWDRLQKFCNKNNIELVEINTVINDLLSELKKKYPKPDRVGKEEG